LKDKEFDYRITPNTICYIHLSIDDYKPDLMQMDPFSDTFYLQRMVPPRKLEYYFSLAETPEIEAKFSHMIPA
jgi:hypothetical protein